MFILMLVGQNYFILLDGIVYILQEVEGEVAAHSVS